MIVGIGIDLVKNKRIEKSIEKYGERFLEKILTDKELKELPRDSKKRIEYVASRFAVKEAASKALGTGMSDEVWFKDFEVIKNKMGSPSLVVKGAAQKKIKKLKIKKNWVSLSHEKSSSIALVIFEK